MNTHQVISALKPRSGKSLKFKAKQIIKKKVDALNFCIVLLSNVTTKVAVVMKENDLENLKVEVSKNYLVKNLVHKEDKSGIPVFKLSKSVFNVSGIVLDNTLEFSKSEVSDLENIDVNEYNENNGPNVEVAPVASNSEVLSLFEFSQLNPKDIKENQFVEMVVLGAWLAADRQSFFGGFYKLAVASSDGKTVNVLLCWTSLREEFMHLESEERLERYSVIKIKASELRSKANLPASGASKAANEAIDKCKQAAKVLLEVKYPGKELTDLNFKSTAPLEVKYPVFNKAGKILKTSTLSNNKIATMLRQLRDQEPASLGLPGSGAILLLQIEEIQFEQTGEFKGITFIDADGPLESKFYAIPEVLEKYQIKIKQEDTFIGVARVVKNNPQTMHDGLKVFKLDWLEPCDESYIEELELLGVTDKADQDLKRKGGNHDSVPLKKSKL